MPHPARFTKAQRLLRRPEFIAAQARGKRWFTPHFGVCLAPGGDKPRLGLAVGRKVGRAVRRNRIKRLVREFFRRHQELLPAADIVIMAKKGAERLTYAQVLAELGPVLLRTAEKNGEGAAPSPSAGAPPVSGMAP